MGTRNHPIAWNYPYLVTTTVAERRRVFTQNDAARLLIDIIDDVAQEQKARCLAYVVMPDHLHLIVVPGRLGLSHFMRFTKGRFARLWNRRFGSTGSIWQARYYEAVIRSEEQLQKAIDYIDQNPIKAGLCLHAEDFPFGSAARFGYSRAIQYLMSPSQAEAWPSLGDVSRIVQQASP